jgi:hypothetical protein
MPSEGRIFALFCSERDHKPQNSGCGYTAQSFHTAWIQNVILLLINVFGIWRWLPRAEKEAKS